MFLAVQLNHKRSNNDAKRTAAARELDAVWRATNLAVGFFQAGSESGHDRIDYRTTRRS